MTGKGMFWFVTLDTYYTRVSLLRWKVDSFHVICHCCEILSSLPTNWTGVARAGLNSVLTGNIVQWHWNIDVRSVMVHGSMVQWYTTWWVGTGSLEGWPYTLIDNLTRKMLYWRKRAYDIQHNNKEHTTSERTLITLTFAQNAQAYFPHIFHNNPQLWSTFKNASELSSLFLWYLLMWQARACFVLQIFWQTEQS